MTFRRIGLSALAMFAVLGGSAFAQGTSNMPAGTSPSPSNGTDQQTPTGSQPNADCAAMRQQVMNTLTAKASSLNAAAAQQAIAIGDKACATGDAQTAQTYYQKALILLNGG